MPRQTGEKTQYAGVERIGTNHYRVRARVTDPRTGKRRERDRLFEGTAKEADAFRAKLEEQLLEEDVRARAPATTGSLPKRPTLIDFAPFWLATKKEKKLDPRTLAGYADALEHHILPHRFEDGTVFGSIYFDALRAADVQCWVNAKLAAKDDKGERRYAPQTVHGWFRAFRTMAKKAVVHLRLGHDPSMLIEFPELEAKHQGDNRLEVPELQPFLDQLRVTAPQHHALTCTLAWTGLRFCHASALQWTDISELTKTIKVQRKNSRGKIGKVSRKKRAPTELPLTKDLAEVLRWHRLRMMKLSPDHPWVARALSEGWCFPARGRRLKGGDAQVGPIFSTSSLRKAWEVTLTALREAGKLDGERFTVHGLRRTFNDLLRQGDVAETTRNKMTAQTPEVRERYQTIDLEEMRSAMEKVMRIARGPEGGPVGGQDVGEGKGKP